MDEKKTNSINYAALRKAAAAGVVAIVSGVVYYVTAWKIRKDLLEPALKKCMEEGDTFLMSWAASNKEAK